MTGLWLLSYAVLWLLFLLLAITVISSLRHIGAIYDWIEKHPTEPVAESPLVVGEPLPAVALATLAGDSVDSATLRGARRAILVVSPFCEPCIRLLRGIAERQISPDPADDSVQDAVVICLGSADEARSVVAQAGWDGHGRVYIDPERVVPARWGITSTPTTVIVDDDLRVVRQKPGSGGGLSSDA